MEITAQTKYLHISSKKLKALGKAVVGFSPQAAVDRLFLTSNKGSQLLRKVIKSAQANAVNNFKADSSSLKISSVEILKGPLIKRWQPVARGIAHQIKKRMSHIKVTLEEVNQKSLK